VWRGFLVSGRAWRILQSREALGKNFIALDGAIEFLLVPNQHIAKLLNPALEVSNADFQIVKTSRLGHWIA
jgi:hypothetical protein